MSFYKQGLALPIQSLARPSRYRQGLVVGAGGLGDTGLFADVQTEMKEIDAEFKSFDSEIFSQVPLTRLPTSPIPVLEGPLGNFYKSVWRVFVDEWQKFRDDRSDISIANMLWRSSIFGSREMWKDLQEYRKRFKLIFDKAKEAGFKIAGPDPTPPKQNIVSEGLGAVSSAIGEIFGLIKIVVIVGIVGVVIFFIASRMG